MGTFSTGVPPGIRVRTESGPLDPQVAADKIHNVDSDSVKLGDIVNCAHMKKRRCTHLLHQGVVPLGPQQHAQRGHHRRFGPGQAFCLVLAYRLSELGVPLRHLKRIIRVTHRKFDVLKMPLQDGFSPPNDELESEYDWCFLMSRGRWMVVVPREHVAAWLAGGLKWYSLRRRRLEQPERWELELGWLLVPLTPIADCLKGAFRLDIDSGF
jgi:hypothetical protein